MHICFFEDSYPDKEGKVSGGAGWYLKILSKEIIRMGHDVTVIKRTINTPLNDYLDEVGVKVLHIHGFLFPYYLLSKIPFLSIFSNTLAYIIRSWKDYKFILLLNKKYKFDILEFTEGGNFWIGFYKKFRYVTFLHCSRYTVLKQALNKTNFNLYLERLFSFISMKRASIVIAPSNAMISIVEKEMKQPFNKSCAIPLCVEKSIASSKRNTDSKILKFIFASRNDPLKGGDTLIKAISLVNAKYIKLSKFYFVGYEPEVSKNYSPNIIFEKFLPREELLKYYNQYDVAILPSLFDNSPLFIYESMAAGLPVIASNVGGIPELIEDGKTGYLFKKNNVEELASHIINLIENPQKRKQMGKAAEKFIYNYASVGKIAKQKIKLYKNMIGVIN